MQNVKFKIQAGLIVAVLSITADRFLKWYAQSLPDGMAFSFFPGLKFGYFLNPSLFFFPAWRFIPWLALTVLTAFIIYCVIHTAYSQSHLLILLGGISNVFDRFAYEGVIDYVSIARFATINLADILIVFGLILFSLQKSYAKKH